MEILENEVYIDVTVGHENGLPIFKVCRSKKFVLSQATTISLVWKVQEVNDYGRI